MKTKTTTDIRERIAVRAYFAWLNGSSAGAEGDWHDAEQAEKACRYQAFEKQMADERRTANTEKGRAYRKAKTEAALTDAKKAAATRKTNAVAKAPVAAIAAKRKASATRATAH